MELLKKRIIEDGCVLPGNVLKVDPDAVEIEHCGNFGGAGVNQVQLGANGNVSEAYEKLEKHLNTMSHK